MKEIKNMNREELIEVVKIKNDIIIELRKEIELYKTIINDLMKEKN